MKDKIQSRPLAKTAYDNWDAIFGKPEKKYGKEKSDRTNTGGTKKKLPASPKG